MNTLLFFPFGLSLPYILSEKKSATSKWITAFLSGFSLSLFIEAFQFLFGCGICEADDVICNSLGTFIGATSFLVFSFIHKKIIKRIKEKDNQFDKTNDALLELISSYICKREFSFNFESVNFNRLLDKSLNHKLTPMVSSKLLKMDSITIDKAEIKNLVLSQVVDQTKKTEKFIKTYKALLDAGIKPVCVKGIICRSLYPDFDLRLSSDEDIVVSYDEFDKCREILVSNGFMLKNNGDNTVLSYSEKETGCLIELHHSLFSTDNSVYEKFLSSIGDIFEDTYTYNIFGVDFIAPDRNKHLLFLILHAFKHFLHSGVGIRQIIDISVFAESFEPDWNYIFSSCKELNIDEWLSAVILISEKYFGLNTVAVEKKTNLFNKNADYSFLLEDIMNGAIYGSKNPDDLHANASIFNKYSGALITDKNKNTKMHLFFVSKSKLVVNYPYVNKHPFLINVARIHRAFDYLKSNPDISATVEAEKSRIFLLKKYKVL